MLWHWFIRKRSCFHRPGFLCNELYFYRCCMLLSSLAVCLARSISACVACAQEFCVTVPGQRERNGALQHHPSVTDLMTACKCRRDIQLEMLNLPLCVRNKRDETAVRVSPQADLGEARRLRRPGMEHVTACVRGKVDLISRAGRSRRDRRRNIGRQWKQERVLDDGPR